MSSEEQRKGPGEEQPEDRREKTADQPRAEEQTGDIIEEPEAIQDLDALAGEEEPEASEKEDVTALKEELARVSAERDDYLDALKRLKAEFENWRKRQERERDRLLRSASERVIRELLPVLDNLDRALEAEGDIREGVRATRGQLSDVLSREGLTPVASDGQPFDPNVHEAVMSQPSEEYEEGTILQTFERGYLLNGQPLRPAKVVVAKQG